MQIGVQLPEVEREVSWSELLEMVRLIEDGGLDSVWVGDHVIYERNGRWVGPWEAWSTMSAIAAVTERIEIGPLVAAVPFHAPAMLAKKAVTLDEISGGRFVLALGAGSDRTDFDALGVSFDHRVARFEEAFTIIRTLLISGEIEFHGDFYHAVDCKMRPMPRTPGGPPLMIGSIGPRMLALTLPFVDRWNAWFALFDNDPATAAGLLGWVDEQAERAGRVGDPVEKALCSLFQFGAEPLRHNAKNGISGSEAQLAALDAFNVIGVDHLHLILDPITIDTIGETIAVVRAWRQGRS
jgi:alkanesulfonate monooxygenase SsuD/methylene tetrahydromethanopterin reductase-like flavin-dependent oxidoreductase (luciferase family)